MTSSCNLLILIAVHSDKSLDEVKEIARRAVGTRSTASHYLPSVKKLAGSLIHNYVFLFVFLCLIIFRKISVHLLAIYGS
jgi:hypothetical protein